MASSTFKSVSDTIRSKAQIFYVDTERPDTQSPAEPTHSGKHEHRPNILSSLRSRTSRNRLNDDFQNSVTTTTQESDMSHEIHVEIPDSTLLETMGLARKVPAIDQAHDNVHRAMVPPLDEVSSRTSIDTAASPVSLEAFIADANASVKQIKSSKLGNNASPIDYSQKRSKADATDKGSCEKRPESFFNQEFLDNSLNENTDHIAYSPPAVALSTRSRLGGNLFVKGNRESTRKYGIPSPYRRALQLSEEAASEVSACNSDGTHEIGRKIEEDLISSRLPLKLTTSISSGLSGLVFISSAQIQSASTVEIEVNNSEAYDADEEYGSERSEGPSMGSKSSWEKARADRQRRYQFVRSMSAETVSDHSDVPGLELRSMKDQLHAQINASNLTTESMSSVATPTSLRKVHLEDASNSTEFNQVLMPSPATIERPYDAELELNYNEQEHDVNSSEFLEHASDMQKWLVVPSSRLQENHSPVLGLQIRTCSAHSDTTTSSCAITTNSQACYQPVPEERYHVRRTDLRRTSGISSQMDRLRHDLERGKHDNETKNFPQLNEGSGCPGISASPVVVRENSIRPPAYVEEPLRSAAECSTSTILRTTKIGTAGQSLDSDLGKRSILGASESNNFAQDLSLEMLPPLPEGGSTPYRESRIGIRTHCSMPGAFEPSPERQSPTLSLRNMQEDDTRKHTPNLFASMSDTRPNSVDFSTMNPEVDHYLAQAYTDVPYRVTESEYSDEENGFRTPITTPLKQDYKVKSRTEGLADLAMPLASPVEQPAMTCQLHERSDNFVAARLPIFAASPASDVQFQAPGQAPTSAYDEISLGGVLLPKDITPPTFLSGRSYHADHFCQTEDAICSGGEFTHHLADDSHTKLQTSSLKKGVWWTRVQQTLKEPESPCTERPKLQTFDDDLDTAEDTLRSIEDRINESNMNIDDFRALLEEPRKEPDSLATEIQTDELEDDNQATASVRFHIVEHSIRQNRKTISDINALLITATPFVKEFLSGNSPDHIKKDSMKEIQWNGGHVANEYQVRSPPVDEVSFNAMDTQQVCHPSTL
ncbi:hypothetical protein MMC34_000988 [Xylographa carneopallida]|nr:hypothetical protein [Xylographa carneopallida]